MWSIKAVSLLVSLAFVGCTFAQETVNNVCPGKSNSTVESVEVYDGPLADMAILIPDEAFDSHGYWNIGYVYEAGRTVNIRCKYTDKTSVDIHLAKKINQCQYNFERDKDLVLHCQ